MEVKLIQEMFQQEKYYSWHVAKRRVALEYSLPFINNRDSVLDFGCGTGALLDDLTNYFNNAFGLDFSPEAIEFCKKRGIKNVSRADLNLTTNLKPATFDAIYSQDVLEHLDNDTGAIGEIYRLLKPKGICVITVPASMLLWSYWDEQLGHKRRYDLDDLKNKIEKTGFKVQKISCFFMPLFPMALVVRKIKTFFNITSSDFIEVPVIFHYIGNFFFWLERKLLKYFNLPFGLSILVVAQKK